MIAPGETRRPPDRGARHGRKARAGHAPSNLIVSGRYILQPEVMRALEAQETGAGGEIQLTDAMAS